MATGYNQHSDDDMEAILQQIHDAELAMALDESIASASYYDDTNNNKTLNTKTTIMNEDVRKAMEDADAEYARQLAAEEERLHNPPPTIPSSRDNHSQPNNGITDSLAEPSADAASAENDMDSILEQIERMEAQKRLERDGHAYRKPLNIDKILQSEDVEEERIRKRTQQQVQQMEWQQERKRQDMEYEESLRIDKLKEQQRISNTLHHSNTNPTLVHEPTQAAIKTESSISLPDETVPKTAAELRAARLAFLLNKKSS